ncbi:helix-turn-helix domain-containing protein [Parafrankia elaeagni]|uniref:helix-turn-helix domain-containing protein n=1 Tax=Parafrankia elaeagni TaxID=222534 RepID=UPI000A03FCB1|nr:helix-turn-helix transcriptional regulator [Parafrankia elaeagni]
MAAQPNRALARRLRRLRQETWPRARLTQAAVAQALGVSTATISSDENLATSVPLERLTAYAAFYAVERSIAGPVPCLFDESELLPAELEARDALFGELSEFRSTSPPEEDPGVPEIRPARRTWLFGRNEPVRLVCGEIPREQQSELAGSLHLNHTELLSYADVDALVELFGHIRAENPSADVRFLKSANIVPDDLSAHLVLLGGLGWNQATDWFIQEAGFPVEQVEDPEFPDGEIFQTKEGENCCKYFPRWSDDPALGLVEDVGLLIRARNPYNGNRTLTICNGVYAKGVLGAVRCLTDSALRERNEQYLARRFGNAPGFGLLLRVPIFKGRALTPDLTNARTTLFEWS